MIVYLDASALVKRYVQEAGSEAAPPPDNSNYAPLERSRLSLPHHTPLPALVPAFLYRFCIRHRYLYCSSTVICSSKTELSTVLLL